MWLISLLHINELPLGHLFTNLDEKICGKDSFLGAYGVVGSDLTIMTNRTINYCICSVYSFNTTEYYRYFTFNRTDWKVMQHGKITT